MTSRLDDQDLVALRLPRWLGDTVMAEPIVRALAARGPVRLIGRAPLLELFGREETLERVVSERSAADRRAHYSGAQAALLLNGSLGSAVAAWTARVAVRAGFASSGRRPFLTHAWFPARQRARSVPGRGPGHPPELLPRPFSAACRELAGSIGLTLSSVAPRIDASAIAVERAARRIAQRSIAGPYLLVHAGARAGSAKGVPHAHFAAVLARVHASVGLPLVLCCAPGEEPTARAVGRELGLRAVLLDDPAPGVGELVALTALAHGVITPDNGARHVAHALGKPVLVLFGPTDPRHTLEHPQAVRGLRVEVPCGPCHRERCPVDGVGRHACMLGIEPEHAASAARALFG